ncbi:LacI family DNA-binding transcriptional regulator [Halobacillus halophilus]|uniref:LacI family DNA-binding transcriptional regulator n=1 Tax=Halobacillus halophilus TaxID=1570 RepID=UPI001CD6526A|nr:LacI family DNA-binding transcriptional regulator [Halobacillus halophilus]MCA1009135.1 LacI family transcriptional regulator [Halobacillus halophilus]
MPTISDVARITGLSKSTISRVINNHPYISSDKREKVLKAMEEIGYYPNPSARRLRGHTTNTIGVIVPRIVNPFFSYLVNSIEQEAFKNNYQVIIFQSNDLKDKELYFLNLLKNRQVDGIIMTSIENDWETIEPFMQYGPILLCNEYVNQSSVSKVRLDQNKGAYMGTEHLINKGHQKIAYCTGGLFAGYGRDLDRNTGYQKAMDKHHLTPNPSWIFIERHSIEDGKSVVKEILSMNDKPTAIFSGSDEVAAGIIIEAKENGLRIPDDLAVVGFDDQPLAEIVEPKLTTIKQPIDEMGIKSVELLIKMMNNKDSLAEEVQLPIQLIEREST